MLNKVNFVRATLEGTFLFFLVMIPSLSSFDDGLLTSRSFSTTIIGVLQDVSVGLSLADARNVYVTKAQRRHIEY